MKKKDKKVNVIVTYTPGYEKRFTQAILKIYEKYSKMEETGNAEKSERREYQWN